MATAFATQQKIHYALPQNSASNLIITSPHSGRNYPADFNYSCQPEQIRRLEDPYVDLLLDSTPVKEHAHTLCALFPRSYIDPNRERNRINPNQVRGGVKTLQCTTQNVGKSGLIFLASDINNFDIYTPATEPTEPEILHRLGYWDAFHDQLTQAFNTASSHNKPVYHIDLHSCWQYDKAGVQRSEIVISTCKGRSCSKSFLKAVKNIMRDHGFNVAVNNPFKGGYITQSYGHPDQGQESLQIEIRRDLYLDEQTLELHSGLEKCRNLVADLVSMIAAYQNAPT